MPKLSIITINYNNAKGLQKTMQSVFTQTFTDYEYIIIDGGSTDGSKEMIEEHSQKLAYWVSEQDEGIYNAMNKGITKSKGEYLLFLNSGDWFLAPKVVEEIFSNNSDADIIYGNVEWVTDGIHLKEAFPSYVSFGYLSNASLPHQAAFINRRLFKLIGLYDEQLPIIADWELFLLAIFKYNCSYQHYNIFVSACDRHGQSCLPENWPTIVGGRKKVIEHYFLAFNHDYLRLQVHQDQLQSEIEELNKMKQMIGYRIQNKFKSIFSKK